MRQYQNNSRLKFCLVNWVILDNMCSKNAVWQLYCTLANIELTGLDLNKYVSCLWAVVFSLICKWIDMA